MAVESGKNGTIKIGNTAVPDITHWVFDKEVIVDRYASNDTAGFKKAVSGVQFGQGVIRGKWDGALISAIKDGTSATLLLFTNATENYVVPAIISGFRLLVDIDDGTVNEFVAEFVTNGAWTEPTLT